MTQTPSLPPGWSARSAMPGDVDALARLLWAQEEAVAGAPTTSRRTIEAELTGPGAGAWSHRVVLDPPGRPVGWAGVQDRAAGRVVVTLVVDRDLDGGVADRVAAVLLGWVAERGRELGAGRFVESTQLDAGAFAEDPRQHRWLAAAGYAHVRTWWQMSRPVAPAEAEPGAFAEPRPGVVLRQVVGDDGRPDPEDVRRVHDVLEAAFTDHFNYHEEGFDEFVERQQREVGHAWDHWWLAEVDGEPAGALVGEVSPGAQGRREGSYVGYLGVTRTARGRGVARSLLHAVIADAAARGRDRVGLEVDADSPTGATALYSSMGFRTAYVTQSWHRDVAVRP